MNTREKTSALAAAFAKDGIGAMVISDPYSIYYLTGLMIRSGERMNVLAVKKDGEAVLITSKLFPQKDTCPVDVYYYDDTEDSVKYITDWFGTIDGNVGVDKEWPAKFLLSMMEKLPGHRFTVASAYIDRLRQIKTADEIALMKEASRLNDIAVERFIPLVKEGFTEKELAEKLLAIYKDLGAEGFSFDPIIGFGDNAADPHHENDDSRGKSGDAVVIDIGCMKDGWCSDMTRTVFIGHASPAAKEIYAIVKEANELGIASVKPGMRFCDIDRAAREHIEKAGYGEYFTHRLGHSIGMEVHEWGDVSSANTEVVKPGMIFSIEPGIYCPGKAGVRIEDLVCVTEDGCEVLNRFTKEMIIVEE